MPKRAKRTQLTSKQINERIEKIKQRFPGAQYHVSCFDTVEEINTKILTDADMILYTDDYENGTQFPYQDYFIIRKKPGQSHILYCDVIDQLIEYGFERNINTDHKFMENIRIIYNTKRNVHALPVYASGWGS